MTTIRRLEAVVLVCEQASHLFSTTHASNSLFNESLFTRNPLLNASGNGSANAGKYVRSIAVDPQKTEGKRFHGFRQPFRAQGERTAGVAPTDMRHIESPGKNVSKTPEAKAVAAPHSVLSGSSPSGKACTPGIVTSATGTRPCFSEKTPRIFREALVPAFSHEFAGVTDMPSSSNLFSARADGRAGRRRVRLFFSSFMESFF